jgi:hypothetical protein
MTIVCLSTSNTPTAAASGADSAPGDAAPVLAWAPALLALAPRVHAEPPDLLWADARGLAARPLAEALIARVQELGAALVRAAVASTPIAARVAVRHGNASRDTPHDTSLVEIAPGTDRQFLAPHPVRVLAPAPSLAALLDGAGVERCGELAALEGSAVAARFGPEGVALWRLARADDPRRLFAPVPPALPHAELAWTDYVLRDPERLLFMVNRLVGTVCAALRERGEGAQGFTLAFALDRGGAIETPFRPARPSASQRAWMRLLRDALERVRLPDAVTGIALAVTAVRPSERVQGDLLDRGFATADAAEEALARVLDGRAVLVTPRASRHPLLRRRTEWERQESTLVWARPQIGAGDTTPELALHLHPEPVAIEVESADRRGYAVPLRYRGPDGWHELVAASGPDCISGGRWETAYALELYCCVRADGELVQLGRDARRDVWELHGMWR